MSDDQNVLEIFALALVSQMAVMRASGVDQGEIFRWMCEEIYGRPIEQLTEPERLTVLKVLGLETKPAQPKVYDLDTAPPPTAEDLAQFSDPLSTAPKASSLTAHAASAKDLAVFLGLLLPGAVNSPPASPVMPIEDQQEVDKQQWESEHPGEKFPRPVLPGRLVPSKHPSPFESYKNLVWTDEPAPETKSSANPWLSREADFADTTTYEAKDEDGAGCARDHKMDGWKGWRGRREKSDSRIQTEGADGGDEADPNKVGSDNPHEK